MTTNKAAVSIWLLVLAIIAEIVLLMFTKLDVALIGLLHVAAFSAITAAAFAWDKWRAVRGASRVSELTLLSMSALGGALGAMLAMLSVRHKTRRPVFWIVVCASLFAHVTIVGWLFISR
jgi:uncharacterized membrane protein YsdA (DUF1294 family)